MGYYIETGERFGKADYLKEHHAAEVVCRSETFHLFPDKDIVAVVDNGHFEAAAFAYSLAELETFTRVSDPRPVVYLALPKGVGAKLSGYIKS